MKMVGALFKFEIYSYEILVLNSEMNTAYGGRKRR